MTEFVNTLVIGAGQAGLATGYFLQRAGIPFLLLDAHARVGDSWRTRWDTLRLFSPNPYNNLPGLPLTGTQTKFPTKDEVADYLERYARTFELPIQTHIAVSELTKTTDGYLLHTSQGAYEAERVVIATGAFHTPNIPAVSKKIPPPIHQLPGKLYRNAAALPPGDVLVVGTGASGISIATDLAATRTVYLSGRILPSLPRKLLGVDIYWWLYTTGLLTASVDSWVGRNIMESQQHSGDAPVGMSVKRLVEKAGIFLVGKTTGVQDNRVTFTTGQRLSPAVIIWATGYHYDFNWIRLPIFNQDGELQQYRGVVEDFPDLYFVGLNYLYRVNSSLLGGVARDAEYIVADMVRREKEMAAGETVGN